MASPAASSSLQQSLSTESHGDTQSSASAAEISFFKPGTMPPVYVAASWTMPPWDPIEMLSKPKGDSGGKTDADKAKDYLFTKAFHDIPPGVHHYKFRLGLGDWWTTAEDQNTATDADGHKNNVLVMSDQKNHAALDSSAAPGPSPTNETKVDTQDTSFQQAKSSNSAASLSDAAKTAATTGAAAIGQIPAATLALASNAPTKLPEGRQSTLITKTRAATDALKDSIANRPDSALVSRPPSSPEQIPLPSSPLSEEKPSVPKPELDERPKQQTASIQDATSSATAKKTADAIQDTGGAASMLDRLAMLPDRLKAQVPQGEHHQMKHFGTEAAIDSLMHFKQRVDTLLVDARAHGLRDIDHITDQEPGHFPTDNGSDSVQPPLNENTPGTDRAIKDSTAMSPFSGLLAGLLGGFFGSIVAWITMWLLFGRK